MPMTRELKKRFGAVEDRIGKLEKKKPSQQTNGEDLGDGPGCIESRLRTIEAVLQIPGETVGDELVLSAWRERVESKLRLIETVLVMPGEAGFVSGFANKVDRLFTSLKERVQKLEQIPDPSSENPTARQLESLKKRMRGSEAQRHTVSYHTQKLLDYQDRLIKLEQIVTSDFPIRVFGRPFTEWVKDTGDRIEELEQKPVAGALSNITQGITEDIKGNTREIEELRSLVIRTTEWFLVFFGITFLLLALSF